MLNTLGFGIIGCGVIFRHHADAIKSIEGARLAAVADIITEKAAKMAEEYGCDYYTDYNELLKRQDIQIVCICTPSGTHSEIGIASARAGKHVITEKPIDITLDSTDRLISSCREAGVKLSCIFQWRYTEDIAKLKKAVEAGKLGQLNFGASHTKWYRSQEYYDSVDWRGTWKLDGGGALMNQSIHYVDILQYIMGPVDEVFAYCATRSHVRIEVEDVAVAVVKFKNGAVGIIEGNTAAFPGFCTRLDVYGSNGSVIIEDNKVKEWKLKNDGLKVGFYGELSKEPVLEDDIDSGKENGASSAAIAMNSHIDQIRDFCNAIRNGTEVPVPGGEARHSLAIILAIYESSRNGKPVKVK